MYSLGVASGKESFVLLVFNWSIACAMFPVMVTPTTDCTSGEISGDNLYYFSPIFI